MRKILPLALIAFIGCGVTKVANFKPGGIPPERGIAVGKIKINYNGNEYTEKCHILFKGESNEEISLDNSGWLLLSQKTGAAKLDRIACLDGSWYFYDFKNVTYELKAQPMKTYIGDLDVVWKTKGGIKAAAMFGAIGALADQSSSDGEMQIQVKNNRAAAESEYKAKFPEDKEASFAESIVNFAELKK